jgi:hypothetical protein
METEADPTKCTGSQETELPDFEVTTLQLCVNLLQVCAFHTTPYHHSEEIMQLIPHSLPTE